MSTPGRHRPPCVSTSTAVKAALLETLKADSAWAACWSSAATPHPGEKRYALLVWTCSASPSSAVPEVLTSRMSAAPRPSTPTAFDVKQTQQRLSLIGATKVQAFDSTADQGR